MMNDKTNSPDLSEQNDTDADFRHAPAPNLPGKIEQNPPPESSHDSAMWQGSNASQILQGLKTAGGVDLQHPHLFHLANAPASVYVGGGLQGAHEENFPILKGQNGAVYLARLSPGGVREPHWHPSAWEMNFVIEGRVRWTFVGPEATEDTFEAGKGDLVFAPQGHLHYFENASETEDLVLLIVFNSSSTEPGDDIGIVQSLSAMPPEALAAVFGGTAEMFAALPKKHGRVVIARKNSGEKNDER